MKKKTRTRKRVYGGTCETKPKNTTNCFLPLSYIYMSLHDNRQGHSFLYGRNRTYHTEARKTPGFNHEDIRALEMI